MRRTPAAVIVLAVLFGCGREEIVHGLDEVQANQVMVALDESGVAAEKRRDEGSEGTWRVEVAPGSAAAAQRVLADRELPRRPPPGFGEVFGKGSVVPTASEERALYLHALSGELARSVEAIDGVVEARVHLALPPQDPLRVDPAPPPRAAVLVKARPGTRARLDPLSPGIQSLVAGAVPGLDAAAVAVVIAEGVPVARASSAAPSWPRSILMGLAGAVALAAIVLPVLFLSRRLPLPRLRSGRTRS